MKLLVGCLFAFFVLFAFESDALQVRSSFPKTAVEFKQFLLRTLESRNKKRSFVDCEGKPSSEASTNLSGQKTIQSGECHLYLLPSLQTDEALFLKLDGDDTLDAWVTLGSNFDSDSIGMDYRLYGDNEYVTLPKCALESETEKQYLFVTSPFGTTNYQITTSKVPSFPIQEKSLQDGENQISWQRPTNNSYFYFKSDLSTQGAKNISWDSFSIYGYEGQCPTEENTERDYLLTSKPETTLFFLKDSSFVSDNTFTMSDFKCGIPKGLEQCPTPSEPVQQWTPEQVEEINTALGFVRAFLSGRCADLFVDVFCDVGLVPCDSNNFPRELCQTSACDAIKKLLDACDDFTPSDEFALDGACDNPQDTPGCYSFTAGAAGKPIHIFLSIALVVILFFF